MTYTQYDFYVNENRLRLIVDVNERPGCGLGVCSNSRSPISLGGGFTELPKARTPDASHSQV